MIRLVKRYESRKLYDTEESRYVSLQEIASFVRSGQKVLVVESATDEDVTAQTLAQVILEEGRSGEWRWSPETLHELLRRGERALHSTIESGADQVHQGVDNLLRSSIGRIPPVRRARDEFERLRERLDQLEVTLSQMEVEADELAPRGGAIRGSGEAPRRPPAQGGTGSAKTARAKPTRKKASREKPTRGKTTLKKTTKTVQRSSGGDT
ncbi:MAG TPA: polyhydroxyalkanoate synthesis regulator DNA-binding domain-containing protein [Thermoanaerobaculia bacterium]|nr:polyhydroxyalkanoate synthesis regulator DNA-binding domain-containing protein [Thermoanaerobaculia bacterium]